MSLWSLPANKLLTGVSRSKDLGLLLAILLTFSAQAQKAPEERLFIKAPEGTVQEAALPESLQVQIHVDPSQLESLAEQTAVFEELSREQIIEKIEADLQAHYQDEPSRTEIEVPLGPRYNLGHIIEDESQLPKTKFKPKIWFAKLKSWSTQQRFDTTAGELDSMSDSDLRIFIARKQSMLIDFGKKVQAFGKRWRLPLSVARINSFLRGINNAFYSAPKNVANSNSGVGEFVVTVQAGASLGQWISEWLVTKLARTSLADKIKTDAGIYFATGLGFGISRTVVNGKKYYALEIFHEMETFRSTLFPEFLLNPGISVGVALEHRGGDERVFKFQRSNIPMVGVTSKGPDHFSVRTGMPLSPVLTPVGVQTDVTRIYLVRLPLNGRAFPKTKKAILAHDIGNAYGNIFHPLPVCRQVFY